MSGILPTTVAIVMHEVCDLDPTPYHGNSVLLLPRELTAAVIPYSQKFLRYETFANFASNDSVVKCFRFIHIIAITLQNSFSRLSGIKKYKNRILQFRKSFIPRKFPTIRYVTQLIQVKIYSIDICTKLILAFIQTVI